jgi:Transposase DDE domain
MARKQRAARQVRRCRSQVQTPTSNAASLKHLLEWLIPDGGIFSELNFHGNTKWLPTLLVWQAVLWSWSGERHLTDAFIDAVDMCQTMFTCAPLSTYQGFMLALVRWTPHLMPLLRKVLHQRMEHLRSKFWRIDGWVPIAFDGSRGTAPRTRANEAAFCATNYGKGKTAKYRKKKSKGLRRRKIKKNKVQPQEPQAWITLMWHMGLRLPWNWRLGPSNSSERAHVMEMLTQGTFPLFTLFCGDAGFVGYPLWHCLLQQGGDFLVRVGANVSLLTEHAACEFEKQGKEYFVLCWPKTAIQSKQPPLRLRLMQVRLGKTTVWMLTSVLEREKLTTQAAVRFYKMRWGIEVQFRGLKQTFDRAKLRCRNDQRLLAELDWSILAMTIAELFATKEQQELSASKSPVPDTPPDPVKRSLAETLRALRLCLRKLTETPKPGEDLQSLLRAAVTDNYERKAAKAARYRPPNPDKKPLGDPKVRPLEPEERRKLQEIQASQAA